LSPRRTRSADDSGERFRLPDVSIGNGGPGPNERAGGLRPDTRSGLVVRQQTSWRPFS
jgi:hypothetical protein